MQRFDLRFELDLSVARAGRLGSQISTMCATRSGSASTHAGIAWLSGIHHSRRRGTGTSSRLRHVAAQVDDELTAIPGGRLQQVPSARVHRHLGRFEMAESGIQT